MWGSPIDEGVPELEHHGLLDPDQVHVHCNTLADAELELLADADAKVSSSPETELQMGMGHPVIGRALELGMKPSLGCDVMSVELRRHVRADADRPAVRARMDNDPVIAASEMPRPLASASATRCAGRR